MVPSRLVVNFKNLGLNTLPYLWILDVQVVKVPPMLYSLHAVITFGSNTIIKFSDNTAVVDLITENKEKNYLKEEEEPDLQGQKKLLLYISKIKDLIEDFEKKQGRYYTVLISVYISDEKGREEMVSLQKLDSILCVLSTLAPSRAS